MEPITAPRGVDFAAGVRRTRRLLLTAAAATGIALVSFYWYSSQAIAAHERRVEAGDFPHLLLENGPVIVEGNGLVSDRDRKVVRQPPRYVASLRLIPPGPYGTVILANDDDPIHRKKTELVIAGRDAAGNWHPPSAAALVHNRGLGSPAP